MHEHALIVGGTGMLRGVALHLAAKGWTISVVARGEAGLDRLVRDAADLPGRIAPLALDYGDDAALGRGVAAAIAADGPLTLLVTWVRESAPRALGIVTSLADAAAGEAAPRRCRFFRVLGSAAADPGRPREGKGARFKALEGVLYREVVLGFRIEGERSRWNSNAEIAAGVVDAIEHDRAESVVGVVRPWAMNPRLTAQRA